MPDANTAWTILGGIAAVLVGASVAHWRGWLESAARREDRERNKAMADAILGEPEVKDRAGGIITPAQPGLVARTATLEEAFAAFINQDARISKVEQQVGAHEAQLGILNPTVAALVSASAERAATSAASAEMLRLMRDKDALDGESNE